MSAGQYIYRVILANLLTVYYSMALLLHFALSYLKNPISSPWVQKIKLERPSRHVDPKYGVHKYIKVNNTILHYVESGDPSKPMMLFLHGFPEFWYSWRYQIVDFQKLYWCIAIDMRGYGDSERPEGVSSYKIEYLVEDVRDLIRQLGRDKCIIVSHDWGGLIACKLRETYPEAVSALVMLASCSSTAWIREIWTNDIQRNKSWYVFAFRAPFIPEKFILMNDLSFYDQAMFPDKKIIDKEDIECYKYWFRKPFALTPPINYYRANFNCKMPEIVEYKEKIPMLVIHASNDPYITHSILDTMKKEFAVCETMILDNTGHFLHQEDPERVNKLIRDFLSKNNV